MNMALGALSRQAIAAAAAVILLAGCPGPVVPASAPTYPTDPQVPGGTTGGAVLPPTGFAAQPQAAGDIALSWANPALYSTLTYQAMIFRLECDPSTSTACLAPDPGSLASQTLSMVYSGTGSSYDDASVQAGLVYTYWAFIAYGGSYSPSLAATATAIATPSQLTTVTRANFWQSFSASIGTPRPQSGGSPPPPSLMLLGKSAVGELGMGGKAALGASGALLFYADTSNNRVVIMERQTAYGCAVTQRLAGSQLAACLSGSVGEPFSPVNVLGQPSQSSSLSCQDHASYCAASQTQAACAADGFCSWAAAGAGSCAFTGFDKCMTAPAGALVDGTNLIVSDSGNDRILVYSGAALPNAFSACDTNPFGQQNVYVAYNCAATSVIGKKSLSDFTDYSQAAYVASAPVNLALPLGAATLRIVNQGALPFSLAGITLQSIGAGTIAASAPLPGQLPISLGTTALSVASASTFSAASLAPSGATSSLTGFGPGGYVEFSLYVEAAGSYVALLNYSSAVLASLGGAADVYVNGALQQSVLLPATGGIATDGDKILSQPGAVAVDGNGNLYIADRGNNRIVRAKGYSDASSFSCSSGQGGAWNSSCRFDQVIGQASLKESASFSQMVFQGAAVSQGTLIVSPAGSGNLLAPSYQNILKRYFRNPTALAFSDSGSLLVAADEGFLLDPSGVKALSQANPRYASWYELIRQNSPVALKSRILAFAPGLFTPASPPCQASTFASGGCDASAVLGQVDFQTLPQFTGAIGSGGSDYALSISYGLTYVTDFILSGSSLMAVDPVTNNIYFWSNWAEASAGQYDFAIANPLGAPISASFAAPSLASITGIAYDGAAGTFVIADPGAGFLYQVRKP
jgi:hypothetical protein